MFQSSPNLLSTRISTPTYLPYKPWLVCCSTSRFYLSISWDWQLCSRYGRPMFVWTLQPVWVVCAQIQKLSAKLLLASICISLAMALWPNHCTGYRTVLEGSDAGNGRLLHICPSYIGERHMHQHVFMRVHKGNKIYMIVINKHLSLSVPEIDM